MRGRGYYLALSALALLLASAPYLYGLLTTPPNTRFLGVTSNIDDCMVYFSWIEEYAHGRLAHRNLFSSEAQGGGVFYLYFLLLGWLSKVFGVAGAFHLGRVLGGAGLLLAVHWLLTLALSEERARRLAFALVCFSSGLGWLFGGYDPARAFAQPIDTFQPEAISFLSLYYSPLFAPMSALMVVFIASLLKAEQSQSGRALWPACVAGAVLGNSHTYDVVPLFLAALLWRLGDLKNLSGWLRLGLVGACTLPTALFNLYVSRTDPLLKARVWANQPTLTPALWWVALGLGIPLALAVFGALRRERSAFLGPAAWRLLLCWAIAHLLAAYTPSLPVQRKLLMGVHLPLCALAGAGLAALLARLSADMQKALAPLAVLLTVPSNALYLLSDIGRLDSNASTTAARPYLTDDEQAALDWLEKNASAGATLVAPDPSSVRRYPGQLSPHLSGAVAGVAHRTAYNGHWSETLDYARKHGEAQRFFASETDDAWRQALCRSGNIGYVLYVNALADGPPTLASGEALPYAPVAWSPQNHPDWLIPAFSGASVTVFQVRLP